LADFLVVLQQVAPDLAAIIHAWEQLPDAIRHGILAMVECAAKDKSGSK
jgi:hypothetical protein